MGRESAVASGVAKRVSSAGGGKGNGSCMVQNLWARGGEAGQLGS